VFAWGGHPRSDRYLPKTGWVFAELSYR
jgi:hypothetical protein